MPKQTFHIGDFSGGSNRGADSLDLISRKQVELSTNGHFDSIGHISYISDSTINGFSDSSITNVSSDPTIVDLDIGIGHGTPSNAAALDVTIANVTTASDDLSWEDGFYDFKYTVCKDLGNGIIEEGPLQTFTTSGNCTNVDMTTDNKGKFTFEHTGTTHPAHMVSGYNGSLCGRVYYSRRSGQGAVTQVGWIHLCDLVQVSHNTASEDASPDTLGVCPRAVNTTGTPTTIYIDIEEPPTSASFEMNAGYPSDVGVHDAVADFGDNILAVVSLGMVKYIAATKSSKYYIYKSLPGQPDIWPTDNWIEMPEACISMHGLGNLLCYFSATSLILFDVTKEQIVKHMSGLGVDSGTRNNGSLQIAAKCGEGIAWTVGNTTSLSSMYFFDGNKLNELSKSRILGCKADNIHYYEEAGWIRFVHVSNSVDYVYSMKTNTWFVVNDSPTTTDKIYLPMFDFGEIGRYKKIYSIIIHGSMGSVLGTCLNDLRDENQTDIKSNFTVGSFTGSAGFGTLQFTANTSTKVRAIRPVLSFDSGNTGGGSFNSNAKLQGISFVYRKINKFKA